MSAAEWALLISAVGGLLVGLAAVLKSRADVAAMRTSVDRMASQTAQIHHETQSNDGSSMRDAVLRIEGTLTQLRDDVSGLEKDVRGVRRDVGRVADENQADRARADREHERLDRRIDREIKQAPLTGGRP